MNNNHLDFLFLNRNKEYGAFELRKGYNIRLIKSLIITIVITLTFLPFISVSNNSKKVNYSEKVVDISPPPKKELIKKPELKKEVKVKAEITKNTPPVFVPKDKVIPNDMIRDPEEIINVGFQNISGEKIEVKITEYRDSGKVAEPPKEEPKQEEDKIYNKVEIEANFKGFKDFLEKNLRYPSDAQEAGQSGVVVIEFVVDREGKISDPHVADNSPVKVNSLVEEAIRIIKKSSGKWAPGIQNGTPVRSYHQQSINFVLAEE